MNAAPQSLAGRAALVTGGSRGIGLAIAGACLSRGASVVITGRDDAHLAAATKELAKHWGERVHGVRADVRDPDDAAKAIEACAKRFNGLDILINNAGVGVFAPVADMDVRQWHDVIETNLSGVFFCCHAAIPHMRARGGGWIINISSLAGKNAFTSGAAYCASKAGLNAFSEALMQEVRYDNIRVSYVMPGSVATEFARGTSPSGPAEDWKLSPDDVAQAVVDLLGHPARSLPSRVELRPSRPAKR
jgi:3-oxoacyl-[acyl-carrier protein] reductase